MLGYAMTRFDCILYCCIQKRRLRLYGHVARLGSHPPYSSLSRSEGLVHAEGRSQASWLRQVGPYLNDTGMADLASVWAMARRRPKEGRKMDATEGIARWTRRRAASAYAPHTCPDLVYMSLRLSFQVSFRQDVRDKPRHQRPWRQALGIDRPSVPPDRAGTLPDTVLTDK